MLTRGGGNLYYKEACPIIDFYGFDVKFINIWAALVYCRHFGKP